MSQRITRRELLVGGIKTGVGLLVLKNLSVKGTPQVLISETVPPQAEHFQSAYKRLDEFVARHRITFDTMLNGRTMRMTYSGIDFYRTFTP